MRLLTSVLIAAAWAYAADLVPVVSTQIDRTVQLPGEIQPFQSVAIHAKITGFVEEIPVDVGSAVKKGDLLARLVAPELTAQRLEAEAKVQAIESQRAEAEAKVAAAASTYDRLKAASATPGVITGNELVQAEKAVDVVKAQVRATEGSANAARAMVDSIREMEVYLKVVAPFDGVITERKVHPGALVGPGGTQPAMLLLEQNSRLRVIVFVPEVEVSGIARGARVTFSVPAFPGERFGGTVARIPRTLDAKTRSMPVELDVANASGKLAPGMFPTVAWPVRRARAALVVPPAAIVTTTERSFVIRSNGGVAEWVDVTKGPILGDGVEVFGNLKAGDQILKRASDEVRPGTKL